MKTRNPSSDKKTNTTQLLSRVESPESGVRNCKPTRNLTRPLLPAAGKKRGVPLFDTLVWVLIVWCVLQDVTLGLVYKATGSVMFAKLLLHAKDVLFAALAIFALTRIRLSAPALYSTILYLLLVIVSFTYSAVASGMSLVALLASARGLVLLPLLGIIGCAIEDKNDFFQTVIHGYFPFLVIIAALGIAEYIADYMVGTKEFWVTFIGLGDLIADVKGQGSGLIEGLPGNFYTYSLSGGFFQQKRLVSIWGGPLTSAFVLLAPAVYYAWDLIAERRKCAFMSKAPSASCLIILCVAIALTFTRVVVVLLFSLLAILVLVRVRKSVRIIFALVAIALAFAACLLFSQVLLAYLYNGSTVVHLRAIVESIGQASIFGAGVGSFGSHMAEDSIATENMYITVFGQLGLVGLVLFVLLQITPIVQIIGKRKTLGAVRSLAASTAIMGLLYCFTGLTSESISSFNCIAHYYLLMGCMYAVSESANSSIVSCLLAPAT